MKKLISIAFCALAFVAGANAQQSTSPAKGLYIGAGFVNNWYGVKGEYQNGIDNAWYYGPFVEVGYDLSLSKQSALNFALRYDFLRSYCGAVGTVYPGCPAIVQADTYRHYFDIPIRYLFSCRVSYNSRFFFDVGPTLNFMLANTTYARSGSGYVVLGGKYVWSEECPNLYNPFNLSLGLTVGFYVDHAKIFVGYDYGGLISFTNANYGKGTINQLRIGAAYTF